MNPKDITIIIPYLGREPEEEYAIRQCLSSLDETVPEIKKIVAINSGPKEVPKFQNTEYITLSEQGQCKAVNAAIATTNTPWIFISNSDMVYPPGWFDYLWWGVPSHAMCVSPRLVEPRPGAPTFLVEFCGGAGGDFNKDKFLMYAKQNQGQGGAFPGFNFPLAVHRELWDTIGGYDINYDPWGSNGDSDLEYKIKLAGVQPLQNQQSLVYHFSQTSGTFHPSNDSFRFRNYAYFKEKWGFDRTDDGIWEATFDIPNEGRLYRPEWEGKYGSS